MLQELAENIQAARAAARRRVQSLRQDLATLLNLDLSSGEEVRRQLDRLAVILAALADPAAGAPPTPHLAIPHRDRPRNPEVPPDFPELDALLLRFEAFRDGLREQIRRDQLGRLDRLLAEPQQAAAARALGAHGHPRDGRASKIGHQSGLPRPRLAREARRPGHRDRRPGRPAAEAKVDRADLDYFEERIRSLLAQPHIEFIGEIGEAEKAEFVSGARALLFPIEWRARRRRCSGGCGAAAGAVARRRFEERFTPGVPGWLGMALAGSTRRRERTRSGPASLARMRPVVRKHVSLKAGVRQLEHPAAAAGRRLR